MISLKIFKTKYDLWQQKSGLSKAQELLDYIDILPEKELSLIEPLFIETGLLNNNKKIDRIGRKIRDSIDNISFMPALLEGVLENKLLLVDLRDLALQKEGINILIISSAKGERATNIFHFLKNLGLCTDLKLVGVKNKTKLTGPGLVFFKSLFPEFFLGVNGLITKDSQDISYDPPKINKDLFVSYASEDRTDSARPITHELIELGELTWYDQMNLIAGTPLRSSLLKGIQRSFGGVAIFSPNYFADKKVWTKEEYKWFIETSKKRDFKVKPVWRNVDPTWFSRHKRKALSEIAAISGNKTPKEIAEEIVSQIKRSPLEE